MQKCVKCGKAFSYWRLLKADLRFWRIHLICHSCGQAHKRKGDRNIRLRDLLHLLLFILVAVFAFWFIDRFGFGDIVAGWGLPALAVILCGRLFCTPFWWSRWEEGPFVVPPQPDTEKGDQE